MSLVHALSRRNDLHLLLEVAPESWRTGGFDVDLRDLPQGVHPAARLIESFPAAVRAYWQDVASFHLVVHRNPRSIHPASWWVGSQAARHIRKLRPDVVHFDDSSLRLSGVVPGLRRLPVAFSIHDPLPHSGENDWRTNLAYWLTLRRGDRFILHSRSLEQAFSTRFSHARARTDVVHLGAYEIFRLLAPDAPVTKDHRTILFFGRISPYKGLDVLYRAAPLIAERVSGLRIIVAGRPIRDYHPPSPPALPNGGRIEVVTRYIPNAQVAELFKRASVVVCPYLDATQSGVVLTAFAFDQAVVATSVGGLPEYIQEERSGLLVAPGDPESLAYALVRVLTDGSLRQHLIGGVREVRLNELNWNRAADATMQVYSKLVGEHTIRSSRPSDPIRA